MSQTPLTEPTGVPATAAEFDVGTLGTYLESAIPGVKLPLQLERLSGGQSNPTYLVRDAHGQSFVLRKKPAGHLLASAHAVEREYRVMKALEGSAVPVARMYCLCEDTAVIGTAFYVMEYVQGRIFWDPALPELDRAQRASMYDEMNRVIGALHAVDPDAVGLADFGRPDKFIERQIDRWTRQYRASQTEPIPSMERLIEWLPRHVPSGSRSAICHGDFRIDNLIFHPTDLAYHALPWLLTAEQFRGMADKNIQSLGIPGQAEYLRSYAERAGQNLHARDWSFYLAFSLFRLAAILQGILKRAMDGTASSAQALETGSKCGVIAEVGWAQVIGRVPTTAGVPGP
jgi:aminoglycoside phosphotransferase (APT) family kinase protein